MYGPIWIFIFDTHLARIYSVFLHCYKTVPCFTWKQKAAGEAKYETLQAKKWTKQLW
jgi:hypothetical protein